ncbi:MAG: hypothetical protein ACRDJU_13730 [Actinomycetota bacterium]
MRFEDRLAPSYRLEESDLDLDAAREEIGRRIAARSRVRGWQRRATWLIPVLALLAVSVPVVQSLAPAGKPPLRIGTTPNAPASVTATVRSVALPAPGEFSTIAVATGGLELEGQGPSPTGTAEAICTQAPVNPRTLKVGAIRTSSCGDPARAGQASIVNSYLPQSDNATLRVATTDPTTDKVAVGQVVMTYSPGSDSNPVTAYGDGLLWVYDSDSTLGPELLELQASTGYVERVVSMPNLDRPVLAVTGAGLWVGNSYLGGDEIAPLYLLKPGANSVRVVIPTTTLVVCWMVGDSTHLWVGMGLQYGCAKQQIWRFDGDQTQPTYHVADDGYTPLTVIGNESDGLWSVVWTDPSAVAGTLHAREVIGIDPDTGAESVATTLAPAAMDPVLDRGLNPGEAVVYQGSLYLLDTPSPSGTSYTRMLKLPLPAAEPSGG